MQVIRAVLVAVVGVAVLPFIGSAQAPDGEPRQWFGVGASSFACNASLGCSAVFAENRNALLLAAGMSGAVGRRARLGGEFSLRYKGNGEYFSRLHALTAMTSVRPVLSIGLELQAHAGVASLSHVGDMSDQIMSNQHLGGIGQLGIAYDVHLTRRFALSPRVRAGGALFDGKWSGMWEYGISLVMR